jgi:hypothetical protein
MALGSKVYIVFFIGIAKKKDIKLYQSIIRSNNYAVVQIYPNIAYNIFILL